MSRKISFAIACLSLLLVCAVPSHADDWRSLRRPLGVYAKVDIETAINAYPGPASPTSAELHFYIRQLIAGLLADPAVSGITVGQHWDNIQLSDPLCIFERSCLGGFDGYDWSYLDDAFEVANFARKPVQLSITPGFDSPKWLLAKIPSCDGLFPLATGSAPDDCGTVTFVDFPEQARSDGTVLPLPWNPVYKEAWWDFLVHLNARYNFNPAFVSFAVGGPVGASPEIILPTTQNTPDPQPSNLTVDETWAALINHSFPTNDSYQHSDQVFIDEWKEAIDVHERIFAGLTLIVNPDEGTDLPEFTGFPEVMPHPDNTLFSVDCAGAIAGTDHDFRSCEAKTEILSYFITVSGPNGKATQVGGLTATSPRMPGNIGISGVRVLTSLMPPPSPAFLGGAEFDFPVTSVHIQEEGCPNYPANCDNLTVEEAAYNVLNDFFYGTPQAASFDG
nr:hypothetical protein [Candidatus Acidoferrales bacterium]